MVEYSTSLADVAARELAGFFVGWPDPPSPDERMRLLLGSDHVVLARVDGRLVGFVTALTDGVLMSYLPLLEVLPGYRGGGIGSELVRRVVALLRGIYGVDICCDDDVVPFYQRLGFQRVNGMMLRRR